MKILFLDIDGVLNAGSFDATAQSTSVDRVAVARLNHVLAATGAKLVLSSSWRYLVLDGSMTLGGFEYLLRTHGLVAGALIGHTSSDEVTPGRGAQILEWVRAHGHNAVWAAVDDHELDLGPDRWRQVRTDPRVGLADHDVAALIRILSPQRAGPSKPAAVPRP